MKAKPIKKVSRSKTDVQKTLAYGKHKTNLEKFATKHNAKGTGKSATRSEKKSDGGALALSIKSQKTYQKFEQIESEYEKFTKQVSTELTKIKRGVKALEQQYRQKVYEGLQAGYAVYLEIIKSKFADDYFELLRSQLIYKGGQKVQKNTPNASLIIRYLWADYLPPPKTISNYSDTLEEGVRLGIKKDDFANWLSKTTITKVLQNKKSSNEENYQDKLKRARILVLRWIETKEINALAKIKTTAVYVEKFISQETNQVVMLGTALRRYDRESFYADIHVTTVLPPNFDIDIMIVDLFAKQIVPYIDYFEEILNSLEEDVWGEELTKFFDKTDLEPNLIPQRSKQVQRHS